MDILAIGSVFAFVLLGTCILFLRRRRSTKSDFPARLAITLMMVSLIFIASFRQYLKFTDHHGLFYFISQDHGLVVLFLLSIAVLAYLVRVTWSDGDD